MEENILEAVVRQKQTGKFREVGFVPGVIYGDNIVGATSVKFDEKAIGKIISKHGVNAKIYININNEKKYGFIKDVQRLPMTRRIANVDVQIVSKDHEIKMQIPINFNGEDALNIRQLQLNIQRSEVSVYGKMAIIPETIEFDVSQMNLGDTVILENFGLNKLLRIESDDATYATIVNQKIVAEEVVEEVVADVVADTK